MSYDKAKKAAADKARYLRRTAEDRSAELERVERERDMTQGAEDAALLKIAELEAEVLRLSKENSRLTAAGLPA